MPEIGSAASKSYIGKQYNFFITTLLKKHNSKKISLRKMTNVPKSIRTHEVEVTYCA
jgi:hypothetical protein